MNPVSGTGQPRVVKQGWVEKKGEYLKNWAKRYLVLYDNGILNGYKTQPSPQDIAELGGKHENKFNVKGKLLRNFCMSNRSIFDSLGDTNCDALAPWIR